MASLNSFPFLVGLLSSAQQALWNNDKAKYFGPSNLAQAIELMFRVRQYSATFAAPVSIVGAVSGFTWDATSGMYVPGALVPPITDTLTTPILLDMVRINTQTSPPIEPNLQQRLDNGAGNAGLFFTGTQQTTNFNITIALTLFTDAYKFLLDDTSAPIFQSWQNYQCQRINDDHYIPFAAAISAAWRNDVFLPLITDPSVNVGSPAYQLGAINALNINSVEVKTTNTSLDVTAGTPGTPGTPIDIILSASKYWKYNNGVADIYNESTGLYSL